MAWEQLQVPSSAGPPDAWCGTIPTRCTLFTLVFVACYPDLAALLNVCSLFIFVLLRVLLGSGSYTLLILAQL